MLEKKKKPGQKGTQLVPLFLLAGKKGIIHSKGVSDKISYDIKTVAPTTKETYAPCYRNYDLIELFENYIKTRIKDPRRVIAIIFLLLNI